MTAIHLTRPIAIRRPRRPRRPAWRHLWLVPGLTIAIVANMQATDHGLGLVPVLAFGILPHLPAWLTIGPLRSRKRLASGTVRLFNVMHQPVVPVAVVGLAAAGILAPVWLVGGLAWLGHVVVDWAMGDGVRASDGSRRAPVLATSLVSATARQP